MNKKKLIEYLKQLARDVDSDRVGQVQIEGLMQGSGDEAAFAGRFLVDYRKLEVGVSA